MHEDRKLIPLIVDLDGSLIRTDSLWEACLAALRMKPLEAACWPLWLLKGKAYFKRRIAERAELEVEHLPYDAEVLAYAQTSAAIGRKVALVTAADQNIADRVAAHLGIFIEAKGSDGMHNLGGRNKAKWLAEQFPEGYEYIGDHPVDVPVWQGATHATSAGRHGERLHRQHLSAHASAQFLPYGGIVGNSKIKTWLSAMRVHQWSKNLLLLVPFIMAGKLMTLPDFGKVLLGILSFSLLASATYIINDMLDLAADRQHPTKSKRAFASGQIAIPHGILTIAVLAFLSLSLLWFLGEPDFAMAALCYTIVTLAYSFHLKREVLLDAMVLSGLYTLRITAGAIVLALPISWWLISFSFLFFFSLALMKRYAELALMKKNGKFKTGRDYRVRDMPVLLGLGLGATFGSVVLFIVYLILEYFNTQLPMFGHPQWLWPIAVFILFWQVRLWLLTNRGEMHQDPIYFALKDKASIKLGALCMLMIALAW